MHPVKSVTAVADHEPVHGSGPERLEEFRDCIHVGLGSAIGDEQSNSGKIQIGGAFLRHRTELKSSGEEVSEPLVEHLGTAHA